MRGGALWEKDEPEKCGGHAEWQGSGARDRAERRITKLGSDLIAALSNKVTLPPDVVGDIDLWDVRRTA